MRHILRQDPDVILVGEIRHTETARLAIQASLTGVREVRNHDAGVASGEPSGTDDNQTVRYEYTDGLQTKLIVDVPSPGTDQETVYTYGTPKGGSAGQSKIATGNLVFKVAYPDSTGGTDLVQYAYDAQGREIWRQGQAGNIFEMDHDAAGRPT